MVVFFDGSFKNEFVVPHEVGHLYQNFNGHREEGCATSIEGVEVWPTSGAAKLRSCSALPADMENVMFGGTPKNGELRWIDGAFYNHLLGIFTQSSRRRNLAGGSLDFLVVGGTYDDDAGTLTIDDAYLQDVPNSMGLDIGLCRIELLDKDGNDLLPFETRFDVGDDIHNATQGPVPVEFYGTTFVVTVPFFEEAVSVQITCGSATDTYQRSTTDPTVTFISPTDGEILTGTKMISWEGQDDDVDDVLRYQLQVSVDNGETFTPSTGLLNETEFEFDTTFLPVSLQRLLWYTMRHLPYI